MTFHDWQTATLADRLRLIAACAANNEAVARGEEMGAYTDAAIDAEDWVGFARKLLEELQVRPV